MWIVSSPGAVGGGEHACPFRERLVSSLVFESPFKWISPLFAFCAQWSLFGRVIGIDCTLALAFRVYTCHLSLSLFNKIGLGRLHGYGIDHFGGVVGVFRGWGVCLFKKIRLIFLSKKTSGFAA